jgi:hypothetical protein
MAAIPVVLLGNIRERALARQAERRDAIGLISLRVVGNRHDAARL